MPVRLDLLVRNPCDMFEAVAEERGLNLRCTAEAPLIADGDPQQLRQLMTNLIDNAIKFTPRGGTVSVRMERDGPGTHPADGARLRYRHVARPICRASSTAFIGPKIPGAQHSDPGAAAWA